MSDAPTHKKSDALYRKEHWFAIRLKNRMYRRLPRVKKMLREYNRKRKDYRRKWYEKNRDKVLKNVSIWSKQNKDKRLLYQKRYIEKLKRKKLDNRQKINRIIEEFIQYSNERYKKDTIRQYKMNMERFLIWTNNSQKIHLMADIDRDLITNYVSFANHDEINPKGMKLTQPEKEARLYPLKTFLLYCQKKGYIKNDLRKFIIVPQREKKILKRVMTIYEMEKFLEAPNINTTYGIRDRALLELSYSGFRAEEMLSLKIGQLDLIQNSVTIYNGKGDKDRVVPMTNEAIYWIKRWLNRRNDFIKDGTDPDYLFITTGKKPILRRTFSKLVKNYAKKANISLDISPHDLRRTTATHLAENGAPIRLIQALLGHATLKVTTKYLRLSDEKIKREYKQTHPSNRRALYYGNLQG